MRRMTSIYQCLKKIIRLLLIISASISVFIGKADSYEYRTTIYGEAVKDIVNYSEDETSMLLRGRISENIDDIFMFNFSTLRDISNDRDEYTWNIYTEGLNDHFDFTAGHFNLKFGSGLVMGKKKFMTADPFTRSIAVSGDEAVIPSTGTNPAGAFFGTAFKIHVTGDQCSIGLLPFYSSQRRYVSAEELSQGYIESSLSTLSERTSENTKYSEGVDIVCTGGMAWFNWQDFLKIQFYGFGTELKSCGGSSLKWEYNAGRGHGTGRFSSAGIFLEYADDAVSIFIEPSVSRMDSQCEISGRALVYGCGVKNRDLMLSVRGKTCGSTYRSEYSAGDRNPENVFEIKTGLIPDKKFEFGASIYSEKNINPSYGRDYRDGTLREELYTGARPVKPVDIDLTAARVRHYCDDLESEKYKLSSSLTLELPMNFFIRIKSDYQKESSAAGYVTACEIKYLFLKDFTLSAGYTEIRLKGDTGVYAAIIPAPEAELCTSLYSEPARGGAIKLKYRREDISFHFRGSVTEKVGESELSAESSLGFVF